VRAIVPDDLNIGGKQMNKIMSYGRITDVNANMRNNDEVKTCRCQGHCGIQLIKQPEYIKETKDSLMRRIENVLKTRKYNNGSFCGTLFEFINKSISLKIEEDNENTEDK
jgi:hypothetical protein